MLIKGSRELYSVFGHLEFRELVVQPADWVSSVGFFEFVRKRLEKRTYCEKNRIIITKLLCESILYVRGNDLWKA
jgi:hypothetical protein